MRPIVFWMIRQKLLNKKYSLEDILGMTNDNLIVDVIVFGVIPINLGEMTARRFKDTSIYRDVRDLRVIEIYRKGNKIDILAI